MERRFEVRREELLADCQVPPEVFSGIMGRLERFAQPYIACLRRPEQRAHAQTYVQGLLSDLKRKNAEAIAYRHDEDRQGSATWREKRPLTAAGAVGQPENTHHGLPSVAARTELRLGIPVNRPVPRRPQ